MAKARKDSKQNVSDILHVSERKLNPVTLERGHALEKHVGVVGGLQISDPLRVKGDSDNQTVDYG